MNVLLIGGGGREHALAWKLAQSPTVMRLIAAPGNPGIEECAECVALDPADHAAILGFCDEQAIDLVVVGPEAPLVAGLADALRAAGIATFGPSAAAAQLEGSKGFTKDLCAAAGIPTAAYVRHDTADAAIAALDGFSPPYVVKADGLAAGKGVVIAATRAEAEAAITDMFSGSLGGAGAAVVIEECMTGEEVSFFALSDGQTVLPFGSAQDHKRVGDGDTGPNTGGMGAYSPATVFTPALQERTMREIIAPTVAALAAQGTPYIGVLFAGLMLTEDGPKLIEYNCRFGDPECQVLMTRFDGDLAALLDAAARGTLAQATPPAFSDDSAITVVIAAHGYPAAPRTGGVITGIEAAEAEGVTVFHAGTRAEHGELRAAGGRVLNVTAARPSIIAARDAAYAAIKLLNYPDGFYRNDIAWREIARNR